MYVISVSRDTGVRTLVTLEFEIETLDNENRVQKELVAQIEADLLPFQEQLYGSLIVEIQRWLSFVLAFKRALREKKRCLLSLQRKRFRRMVLLKREVDLSIRKPDPLDFYFFRYKYSDISKVNK